MSVTVPAIPPLDAAAMSAARARQDRLTKPGGALGRLEEIAVWMAGVRAEQAPTIRRPVVVVAAADHGVTAQGVSAYPAEVTGQMVANFLAGGAAISVLAKRIGARLAIVDAGVARSVADDRVVDARGGPGTADMTIGPAMPRAVAERLFAKGAEWMAAEAAAGTDALLPGDMGIGNTTAAAAVTAVLLGLDPEDAVGPGTGLDEAGRRHKASVVARALATNTPDREDPIGVVAKVGGFEIAFLAGAMLAAAAARVPIVLDGFITGAAALIAWRLEPRFRDYVLAAHVSAEPGHRHQLEAMAMAPLLDLGMRLGEGSGAAIAFPLVQAALDLHREMATFDDAAVSGPVDG